MRIRDMVIPVFATALLAVLAFIWFAPSGFKQAPDLELTTIQGESLRLAELRGGPVLVTFWATTCVSCMKEMPHLVDLYRDLGTQGLEIIGVAMDYDPVNDVVELSESRQIPYLIAHDTHSKAAQAFGNVRVTPTSFLIAPDGRIVQHMLGMMDMAALRAEIAEMLVPSGTL